MNLLSKPFAGWATAWNSNEFFRARIKLSGLYIAILFILLGIEAIIDTFYANVDELIGSFDLMLIVLTAVLSYFLAGRTLKPIATKMQQQKEFSANAAHELRNPLAAIRSSAESVLHTKSIDAEECRAVLQDIVRESDHLIGISEQLLTLSRFDEAALRTTKVQLHTLIAEVIRAIMPLSTERQITIRHELAPFALKGDKSGLKQLVFNLLHNALKFAPAKSNVHIILSADGVLSVEDHGRGIATEHIPKLFDRFYAEDASRGEEETGSGLGLSIVQTVAKSHGAVVKVKSTIGQGTTFTVIFT